MRMRNLIFLLPLVVIMACNGKKEVEQDVEQKAVETEIQEEVGTDVQIQDVPPLTKERIAELWEGVPDRGLKLNSIDCLSKSFFKLVDLAFAMPSDAPGEIGSEECLCCWYIGMDFDDDDHVSGISIDEVSDTAAKVTVTYMTCKTPEPHTLILIPETRTGADGQSETVWIIDEFDDKRKVIFDYLNSVGIAFKNGLAEKVINDTLYSTWMTDEEKELYLKEAEFFVKRFNNAFPDGVVKMR